jgi:RNA polymerase sigma-70 factor (ECF subfamily)
VDEKRQGETELRAAVLAGDEAAWRALYDRYFDALYGFILTRTGGRVDRAEDVAQETWLVAVRRMRSFNPRRAAFGTWLAGIARKALRNHRRRWRREAQAVEAGDNLPAPAKTNGRAEETALAMAGLPERYQAALRAKYEEQLSVAEMAAREQTTEKAVESLLSRARRAFKQAYATVTKETS